MKVAIMQPYFLPYIGYFQLINAVDIFLIYDDVNYIKRGYINRNSILVNGAANLFSISLKDVSQNKLINEISIDTESSWKKDLLKTLEHSYKKAPHFEVVFPLVESIINHPETNLAKFIANTLREVCNYLHIDTKIIVSSEIEKDNSLKGQDKILEISKKLKADEYINAIGGMELYDRNAFSNEGIALNFIKTQPINYSQFKNEFIPWLSIIDVMMFNSSNDVKTLLNRYELV